MNYLAVEPRVPETNLTQRGNGFSTIGSRRDGRNNAENGKACKESHGEKYLCLAGGVALNCVGNGKLLRENIFDDIWIQPAAGDAGGAIGAAYIAYHQHLNQHNDKVKTAEICRKVLILARIIQMMK